MSWLSECVSSLELFSKLQTVFGASGIKGNQIRNVQLKPNVAVESTFLIGSKKIFWQVFPNGSFLFSQPECGEMSVLRTKI